jgi:hypothetical protein
MVSPPWYRLLPAFVVVLAAPPATADAAQVGRVAQLAGELSIRRAVAEAEQTLSAKRGDAVLRGDSLRTGKESLARLLMRDNSLLTLGADTQLTLSEYRVAAARERRQARLKVLIGRLWARVTSVTGTEGAYQIETGNAVAGVRGTELVVDVDASGLTQVTVISGEVGIGPPGMEPAELLGALQRGTIDPTGQITRTPITLAEARALTRALAPPQQLDGDRAEQRLAPTTVESGPPPPAAPEPETPGESEGAPDDQGPDQPPLDLEPSSGRATVKGRVEVRE